jgi:hypothetical protein
MMLGFKFQLQPKRNGFNYIVPLKAFTTVWCTEAGRIKSFIGCTEAVIEGLSVKAV